MSARKTILAVAVLVALAGCALEPSPKPEDIRSQAMPNVAGEATVPKEPLERAPQCPGEGECGRP